MFRTDIRTSENVIIVQMDPLVQEVWDSARKITCSWEDSYEKSIRLLFVVCCNKWANNCSANEPIMFSNCIIYSFQPFTVGGLSPGGTVTMDRNNVKFWMEIKSGRYPDVSLSKLFYRNLFPTSFKDSASDRSDTDRGGPERHDLHQRQDPRQTASWRDGQGLLGIRLRGFPGRDNSQAPAHEWGGMQPVSHLWGFVLPRTRNIDILCQKKSLPCEPIILAPCDRRRKS